jgi:RNA polymerase primary sigma factor
VNGRLRDALEAAGLPKGELARRVGVGASAVSNWLSGERTLRGDDLEKVASELGVPAVWLETGAGGTPAAVRVVRDKRTGDIGWAAPRVPEGFGRIGGNPALFAIHTKLAEVAREANQNSLDARLPGLPARVHMRLHGLTGEAKTRFLAALRWPDLLRHLKASIEAAPGQQVATALAEGRALEEGELLVLTIADYNTCGLTGADYGGGEDDEDGSKFAALVRDTLFSEKGGSDTAGGSYGLGKFTAVAASATNCVLYHSDLSEPLGGRSTGRLMGRAELVWHKADDGGAPHMGPMWLGDLVGDDVAESHWADADSDLLADLRLRRRGGTGTTVAIVGLRDLDDSRSPEEMVSTLRAAVAESFFAAIESGNLQVDVDYLPVSRGGEPDPAPHAEARVRPDRDPRVRGYVEALRAHIADDTVDELVNDGEVVRVTVPLRVPGRVDGAHGVIDHEAVLLVRRADSIDREAEDADAAQGRVAVMREPRMTVRRLDVSRSAIGARPFQAVLLAGRAVGDSDEHTLVEEFLRAAEPPAHDRWEINETVRQRYKRGARKALSDFEAEIRRAVRAVVVNEPEPEGDGPRDLSRRFRFGGRDANPERAPRVTVTGSELKDGAWHVSGRIRVPHGRKGALTCRPRLAFTGESGGRSAVKWAELHPVRDCDKNADGALVIPAGKRTALFRAVSDPGSHPVPAADAAVTVDLRVEAIS